MNELIIAGLSVAGTVIIGWLTFQAQRKKDDQTARSDLARLQEEIETGLWMRLKSEIDGLQAQLTDEREKRRLLEERVILLERENQRLQRENDTLRAAMDKMEKGRL